jgi:hypothetical protein
MNLAQLDGNTAIIFLVAYLVAAAFYAIPAAIAFRKGRVFSGVLCVILALILGLGSAGVAFTGHERSLQEWFFYGGGLAWVLLLIYSIAITDYRKQAEHESLKRQVQALTTAQRRQRLRRRDAPRFIICARCGERSNAELPACWKCGQSFVPEPAVVSAPPAIVAAPPSIVSDAGDATPIMPTPAALDLGTREIKVRCKDCGKRYSGTVEQIAALRACPRCKASPFDAVTAEP